MDIQAQCWPRMSWAVEFLGLWNWAEDQGGHFSLEEQGQKHHRNKAQDWRLAPRDKEGVIDEGYQTSSKIPPTE